MLTGPSARLRGPSTVLAVLCPLVLPAGDDPYPFLDRSGFHRRQKRGDEAHPVRQVLESHMPPGPRRRGETRIGLKVSSGDIAGQPVGEVTGTAHRSLLGCRGINHPEHGVLELTASIDDLAQPGQINQPTM